MESLPVAGIIGFFITALVIELTPGPNMAYLALLSAQRGHKPGLFAVAGVALGLAIVGGVAAIGLAGIIAQNEMLYQTVRWAGVAYLVWLAFDSWRDARKPAEQGDFSSRSLLYFRRGLITNLLNPKAAVFYIAVLPNFLPANAQVWAFAFLAGLYVLAATLVHTAIVIAAGTLQPFFVHDDRRKMLGAVFAILLVLVAVWLAFSTRI